MKTHDDAPVERCPNPGCGGEFLIPRHRKLPDGTRVEDWSLYRCLDCGETRAPWALRGEPANAGARR